MKNNLAALNNYLFEQIERLNDDEQTQEALELTIKRSRAVVGIAKTIIDSGNLALQAQRHLNEYGSGEKITIPLLGIGDEKR